LSSLIVQKFGGTSVGSIERISKVVERVASRARKGHRLAIVVSAMAGETDRMIGLAKQFGAEVNRRELDALLATGEQACAALISIALSAKGIASISFQGGQVPIRTDSNFGNASIQSVAPQHVLRHLDEGKIVIVAGYQGVTDGNEITTLGRGGSDLTAVALAAALDAEQCEIYTDVSGVFTADPQVCSDARLIRKISYDEMLELASLGAKVLQARSVQLAKRYMIPIWVGSSFEDAEGTWVTKEELTMEGTVVSGISCDRKDAKISLRHLPDPIQSMTQLFSALADIQVVVDVIVQDKTTDGKTNLTFTIPRENLHTALKIAQQIFKGIPDVEIISEEKVAKISAVGLGMRTHSGVAAKMFQCLAREGIEVWAVSTSEIKISCVIDERYAELAVRALHDQFGLAKEPH